MIRGCIGRGGAGKSLYTVNQLLKLFDKGREIYSNTPLIDLRVKRVLTLHRGLMWVPVNPVMFGHSWASGYLTKFDDVYNLDNCDCLLDELAAWMPAHKWQSIPDTVRNFLHQDRREGVNVWWTHRTDKVFHEVRDNTVELVRCSRYGPFVVAESSDPQEGKVKPIRKYVRVSPSIYDAYDTFAKVGTASGAGYGQGKRRLYGGGGSSIYWIADLPTMTGETLRAKIRLRPEQVECLIRKFGAESVGFHREENQYGAVRYVRGDEYSIGIVRLADDPELLELRGVA